MPSTESRPLSLVAPNGNPIAGTRDTIPGVALVHAVFRYPDGTIEPQYVGDTDVDWNGQETVMVDGQRTYYDEDDNVWREDQLVPVEAFATDPEGRGRPLNEVIDLWDQLGAVPADDNGRLLEHFRSFSAGTPREEVWRYLESLNPYFSAARAQEGAYRPIG